MTESALQAKVIKKLEEMGYVTAKVIVANKAGVLDIIACCPRGHYVEIEVKYGDNTTSKLQQMRTKEVQANNGTAFTVWSIGDLMDGLKQAGLETEIVQKKHTPVSKPLL